MLLREYVVETAAFRGWDRLTNGDSIATAESEGYDLFITADQNLTYQQNLRDRRIAIVVLGSNIWPLVKRYEAEIRRRVLETSTGTYSFIEIRRSS